MLKVVGKTRLTKSELEEIRESSGITATQFDIIKLKYFDADQPSVLRICDIMKISESTYAYQLKKALAQIKLYFSMK